jgi:hypothetical protein
MAGLRFKMNPAIQILLSVMQIHFSAILGYTAWMLMVGMLLLLGGQRFDTLVNYMLVAWVSSVSTYMKTMGTLSDVPLIPNVTNITNLPPTPSTPTGQIQE